MDEEMLPMEVIDNELKEFTTEIEGTKNFEIQV